MSPKGTKEKTKDQFRSLLFHMTQSLNYLLRVRAVFEPSHKELADELEEYGKAVVMLIYGLEKFWQKCWGDLPKELRFFEDEDGKF